MVSYVIKRIAESIPTIIIGITLTFLVIHLSPGDPGSRFMDPSQPSEYREILQNRFGLNDALHIQYIKWLKQVLFHFDFGNSFYNGKPASGMVFSALRPTMLLAICSLIFALIVGIFLGIIAAVYRDALPDRILTAKMMFFFSTPSFWLGIMLLGIFSIKLGWFPASHLTSLYHDQLNWSGRFADYIHHLILPVITLGLPLSATFYRYVRTGMIEALESEYILASRARGLSVSKLLFHYSLKNSLIPLISVLGITIPALLSGALVVEVIFSLPGLGRTMVSAVFSRDYPIILAASTLAFVTVIVGNLLADVIYSMVDPRIRIKTRGVL